MSKEEKRGIKITERVEIVGAAKAKHLTPGKTYRVHPETAKDLVAKKEAEYPKESK